MRLSLILTLWIVLAPIKSADASPLPPTVLATVSANGRILCYLEVKQHSDDNGNSYWIDSVTYHILTHSEAAGPYIGALVPATPANYWTAFAEDWSVTLTGRDAMNWPIVSNDGGTLALVSYGPPSEGRTLLSVYHRARGSNPSLVGSFTLVDLWVRDEITPASNAVFTDDTRPWYASGSFTFPSAGELVYTDPWHHITRVDVVTGKVTHTN